MGITVIQRWHPFRLSGKKPPATGSWLELISGKKEESVSQKTWKGSLIQAHLTWGKGRAICQRWMCKRTSGGVYASPFFPFPHPLLEKKGERGIGSEGVGGCLRRARSIRPLLSSCCGSPFSVTARQPRSPLSLARYFSSNSRCLLLGTLSRALELSVKFAFASPAKQLMHCCHGSASATGSFPTLPQHVIERLQRRESETRQAKISRRKYSAFSLFKKKKKKNWEESTVSFFSVENFPGQN